MNDWEGRVLRGDCRDHARAMAEAGVQVDLVIADPPYNARKTYGPMTMDAMTWPDYAGWLHERISALEAICRGPVLVFASVPGMLQLAMHGVKPPWVAVWQKPLSLGAAVAGRIFMPHWEPILCFGDLKAGPACGDVFSHNTGPNKWHPTQKPLSLMRDLVTKLCPDQGLVYEPFAGSASGCVAAQLEGRHWIASEIEEAFVAAAERRLAGLDPEAAAQRQLALGAPEGRARVEGEP